LARRQFHPPDALRIPFVRRCVLESSEGTREAMTLDISLKGMFIATRELPAIGLDVAVQFRVPSNVKTLSLPSRVAWLQERQTHPIHGLPPGFGIFFRKLEVEQVRLIARTIQGYCLSNPLYRQYL